MLSHKLAEIGAVCTIGLGYCAREYELIQPDTFKLIITIVSMVGVILVWRLLFEPSSR